MTLLKISPMLTSTAMPGSPKSGGSTVTNTQAYRPNVRIWKTLLTATRPAAYSLLPRASWFHTSTMAMQRAMPTRMRPTM
jgi:hypothetical protein